MSRQTPPSLSKFCSFAVSFVPPARRSQRQDGSRSCWICNSSCIIYFLRGFFLDFPPIGAVRNRIATPCWFHSYSNVFIFLALFGWYRSYNHNYKFFALSWFFDFLIMIFFWFVPCLDVSLIFCFSFHVFMLAFFSIFVSCHDLGIFFFLSPLNSQSH